MLVQFDQDLPKVQSSKIPHIGFVLDESSSMTTVWHETMDGFNSYTKMTLSEIPDAKLTFASFVKDEFKLRCEERTLDEVLPLNMRNYTPYGGTPLIDSIMKMISLIEKQVNLHDAVQPIIVIQTDGHENKSKNYNASDLRKVVTKKRSEGWQFILITCNLNSTKLAGDLGIDPASSLTYGRGKSLYAFEATARLTTQGAKTQEEQVFSLEDQRRSR